MKYLIYGVGGTGGAIAGYLAGAGKDVTVIARGENLRAIRENGLTLLKKFSENEEGEEVTVDIKAVSADEYAESGEHPDVVFLCTKGYSVESAAPFLNSVVTENTILIPILNGIRMGDYVRRFIHGCRVIDGCIYIISMKDGPGRILMKNSIFRVVFGSENNDLISESEAEQIYTDLTDAGIKTVISDNILRDTIRKYSYIGPAAGTGIRYNCKSGGMHEAGPARDFFISMVEEVGALAESLGVQYDFDLVETNLRILDNTSADSDTSLQRDIAAGGNNEFASLIEEPARIGSENGVDMPCYNEVIKYYRG